MNKSGHETSCSTHRLAISPRFAARAKAPLPSRRLSWNKTSGFTLIELMVTIAIAAILVTTGVPAFTQFVQNNRRASQVNMLVRALQIARSEAVRQRTTIGACASSNQTSCSASTTWSTGWIVFVDKDGDGVVDSGEDVLNVFPELTGGNSLTSTVKFIDYEASGLSTAAAGFTLCDPRGTSQSRAINVSATGAVSTSSTVSTNAC